MGESSHNYERAVAAFRGNDFRGPDVFVVLDVDGRGRKSWVAWHEGGRLPDVVVEITSPSTAHVDRGEKMRIYAQVWRTPAYFIFDPDAEELEGFVLDAARRCYVPLERNERGDFPVAAMGLALGLRPTSYRGYEGLFMRWIDDRGELLLLAQERVERERERAERERERAERESARVRELEERLRQLEKNERGS